MSHNLHNLHRTIVLGERSDTRQLATHAHTESQERPSLRSYHPLRWRSERDGLKKKKEDPFGARRTLAFGGGPQRSEDTPECF